MISDSWPWKEDLARRTGSLQRRQQQRRWSGPSFAAVERDVFFSAYSVRKLLDAGKISDQVEAESVRALEHPAVGRTIDIMNCDKLDELYNLSTQTEVDLSLREFCNQIVHSFVFMLSVAAHGSLEGFFVASDRDKDQRLLYFAVDDVAKALLRVADDDIVTMQWRRDEIGGAAKITHKSNRHEVGT